MFGNIGLAGFIVILFTILLLWGPTKLPELGKAVGETLRNFREAINDKSEKEPKK